MPSLFQRIRNRFTWFGIPSFILGAGMWLVSTFAPINVPHFWAQVLFYLGISFIIIASALFVIGFFKTPAPNKNLIVPKLHVKPFDILDDNKATTAMKMHILNYSDYVAKSISVDVKFGDSLWKKELHKAVSLETHNKLWLCPITGGNSI